MVGSFEENIIQYCAPTLAGLKAGSLFSCFRSQFPNLELLVSQQDRLMKSKGIRICVLADKGRYLLVYCYRPAMLQAILDDRKTAEFMSGYGYSSDLDEALDRLSERLEEHDFPHEVGIFLDYPLEDVKDFIRYDGQNYLVVGDWKVYHNPQQAVSRFESFRRCLKTLVYHFQHGRAFSQLIVSM